MTWKIGRGEKEEIRNKINIKKLNSASIQTRIILKKTQRHEKIIEHFIDEVSFAPPTKGPGFTVTCECGLGVSVVFWGSGGSLGQIVQGSWLTCLAVEHAGRPSFKRYAGTKLIFINEYLVKLHLSNPKAHNTSPWGLLVTLLASFSYSVPFYFGICISAWYCWIRSIVFFIRDINEDGHSFKIMHQIVTMKGPSSRIIRTKS